MTTSKRKFEGLAIIDHRDSPGITMEEALGRGPAVGKGQILSCPTYGCVHCQRVVIMNPLRSRPRTYCTKCDDYVCDLCEAQRVLHPHRPHRSFEQLIEAVQNAGAKGVPHGLSMPL